MNVDLSTAGKTVAEREDEGTVVHLRDETNAKMYFGEKNDRPVTITVAGTYSRIYRRASDANRDRMLKRRGGGIDGDQLNQQSLELVAACIIAWDGLTAGDQPFPLNKANAVALLDQCPWIREQVESAMNDHAAFFKAS